MRACNIPLDFRRGQDREPVLPPKKTPKGFVLGPCRRTRNQTPAAPAQGRSGNAVGRCRRAHDARIGAGPASIRRREAEQRPRLGHCCRMR